MTDQTNLPTDPTAATDPSQQNPLDILEKLLQDTKSKKAASAATDPSTLGAPLRAPVSPPTEAAPAVPAEEPSLTEEDYERIRAEHDEADQVKIEEQKVIMEQLKQSPQYKARVQQDEEKASVDQAHQQDQDGFQIEQLDHTKI